jgi:hypothetical protein
VVGYSDVCAAPAAWIHNYDIDTLPHGRQQVYYHILPDTRDMSLAPLLSPRDLQSSSSSSVSASASSSAAAASSSLEEEQGASGAFQAHSGLAKDLWIGHCRPAFLCGREVFVCMSESE